jgi:G3E family GTPase
MSKLNAIPCNLITGFLGVGKTTCILSLLKQKPKSERWAVLVNEFGEIGLDGKLMAQVTDQDAGVFIREVPGGCMCCSSGVPMQIALNMLLMKARPHRLLIEPTGLGHPEQGLKLLSSEHFSEVLLLQNTLTLVNPKHFGSTRHLHNETFQQQLKVADVLIVNKTDLSSDEELNQVERYLDEQAQFKQTPRFFTKDGSVPLSLLDKAKSSRELEGHALPGLPETPSHRHNNGESELPVCGFVIKRHDDAEFSSIGWRVDGKRLFDPERLMNWLNHLNAVRIKALVHTPQGWASLNISEESDKKTHYTWNAYARPVHEDTIESRLEIIYESSSISEQTLADWINCLLDWNQGDMDDHQGDV